MIRNLLLVVVFLTIGPMQAALGEITLTDAARQSAIIETGTFRAVYLGRLFATTDTSTIGRVTGMYASTVIRGATNVSLFAGTGSVNFNSLLAGGNVIDTGLKFSNTKANSVEAIFMPGFPNSTAPFSIDPVKGTALADILRTNGRMDFWLAINDGTSTFTAPSNIGTDPANFFVDFRGTAVPEPSSLALGGLAMGLSWWRLKRRKKQNSLCSTAAT